jgi:sugar/nucleoside kinase (ribokinase family)
MADPDLLVVGELNVDVIMECGDAAIEAGQVETLVEDGRVVLGSSGAITACGAARLGLNVAMVGAVGEDMLGRFVLDELVAAGVDVSGCQRRPGRATGMTVVLARGGRDRSMLTFPGEIGRTAAADVPERLLHRARHLHISSWFLQRRLWSGAVDLLEGFRGSRGTTSIDPNFDPARKWRCGLDEVLPALDLFLPNEGEAIAVADAATGTATDDGEQAARALAALGPTVVVKRGAAGAFAAGSDGSVTTVAAPIVTPVETTGAGDSFDAGLLAGLLDGLPLEDALRLACACGALATTGVGGTAGQPDRRRADELAGTVSTTAAHQRQHQHQHQHEASGEADR